MSYDSQVQYRQTLGLQELNDAHPVVMVYIWRLLLRLYDHAGVLLIFFQLVYWCGTALFVCWLTKNFLARLAWLLVIGLCPPLVILSIHLWKDVGMLCALAIATAALLGYVRTEKKRWLLASAVALFLAVAIRANGFIPAMPLLLLTCIFAAKRLKRSRFQIAALSAVAFCCVAFAYGLGIKVLNLESRKTYGLGTLIVWDMVEISLKQEKDLLPKYLRRNASENFMQALKRANSENANYPSYSVISPYPPEEFQNALLKDWMALVIAYPADYIRHRMHVLGVLLGIEGQRIYYPYHPGIDENDFGIWFSNTSREELVQYFQYFDCVVESPLYRPWIYALLSMVALVISSIRMATKSGGWRENLLTATVASSGLLSAASLFFIATAADYRYITWTILAALLAAAILGTDVIHSLAGRSRLNASNVRDAS